MTPLVFVISKRAKEIRDTILTYKIANYQNFLNYIFDHRTDLFDKSSQNPNSIIQLFQDDDFISTINQNEDGNFTLSF